MRRAALVFAVLILLGLAGTVGWWFTRPKPLEVPWLRVARTTFLDSVAGTTTGVVDPARRLWVQPELAARILEVKVHRGDRVKAGDPLVVLDGAEILDQMRVIEATLPVMEARIQQAETRADQVARDADRAERLTREGSLPAVQRDNAASAHSLAKLDVVASRAALQQARVQFDVARSALRHTVVRAPFDGDVLDVDAEVGQIASPMGLGGGKGTGSGRSGAPFAGASAAASLMGGGVGGASGLVDIADQSRMAVEVDLDERDYGRVRAGMDAQLTIDALGKRVFTGTVDEVYPFISRALDQNRTARIRVRLPDDALGKVLAGMSVQVEVLVARKENVLTVPTTAVMTRGGKKVVWRVIDGVAHATPIEVEASTWESTVVGSGLAEGDILAVPRGITSLKDGQKVQVSEVATP